jgi:hypothetical protein
MTSPKAEAATPSRVVEVPGHPVPVVEHGYVPDPLVEAGVLDGDAGDQAKGAHQCLVVSGELGPANLVGQVEDAEDLTTHGGRHPQERGHLWVMEGDTEAVIRVFAITESEV